MAARFQRNRRNLPFRSKSTATGQLELVSVTRTGASQLTCQLASPAAVNLALLEVSFVGAAAGAFFAGSAINDFFNATTIVFDTTPTLAANIVYAWLPLSQGGTLTVGNGIQGAPVFVL